MNLRLGNQRYFLTLSRQFTFLEYPENDISMVLLRSVETSLSVIFLFFSPSPPPPFFASFVLSLTHKDDWDYVRVFLKKEKKKKKEQIVPCKMSFIHVVNYLREDQAQQKSISFKILCLPVIIAKVIKGLYLQMSVVIVL